MYASRAAPPSLPVMATDGGRSLDERGRETFRQLEALRASTATRGGGSLTIQVLVCSPHLGGGEDMKFWNSEAHLGAVYNCNGAFTSSFSELFFSLTGGEAG